MDSPLVRLMPWPVTLVGSYNGFFTSIPPYWVGNLQAGEEVLADFQLADLPAGSCLYPSLRYDAQVPLLREWYMVGAHV